MRAYRHCGANGQGQVIEYRMSNYGDEARTVTKSEFERLKRLEQEARERITNFSASNRLPRHRVHDRKERREQDKEGAPIGIIKPE